MMLTISLRQSPEDKNITIMVEEEQKIEGTLQVLAEAGIIEDHPYRTVQSYRSKERVSVGSTYKESRIYNGDILMLKV